MSPSVSNTNLGVVPGWHRERGVRYVKPGCIQYLILLNYLAGVVDLAGQFPCFKICQPNFISLGHQLLLEFISKLLLLLEFLLLLLLLPLEFLMLMLLKFRSKLLLLP